MQQHAAGLRIEALSLLRSGVTNSTVAARLGVPVGTVSWWRHRDREVHHQLPAPVRACPLRSGPPTEEDAYVYLLGLYLGDGHIAHQPSKTGRGGFYYLSISCGDAWPGLIAEAESAVQRVFPRPRVRRVPRTGCTVVRSNSIHWPCFFPQHGPGRKHERPIALAAWQQHIVDRYPWQLVRGLIHSDGCRITNWTVRTVAGRPKRYEYPRYMFSNESADIMGILTRALDSIGAEWTYARPNLLSVARRASVALMDEHVGPKH